MPDRNANVPMPLGSRLIRENRRRTYELERGSPPTPGSMVDLDSVAQDGFLDTGFGYHHDYERGLLVPARPGVAAWSWFDPPQVGLMSGPWPLACSYVGKVYQVSVGAATAADDDDALVGFYINGAVFEEVTLPMGVGLTSLRGTWPTPGTIADVITAELLSYPGSTLAGLTAHAWYL
jgi:hypothetical protein